MASFDFRKNKFTGVLALEEFFPRKARRTINQALSTAIFLILIPFAYALFLTLLPDNLKPFASLPGVSDISVSFWGGIILLFLIPRVIIGMLDAFSNSKTHDIAGSVSSKNLAERFNFYASELWYRSSSFLDRTTKTLLDALPETAAGKLTLLRLGILENEYREFVKDAVLMRNPVPMDEFLKTLEEEILSARGANDDSRSGADITFAGLFTALIETHRAMAGHFAARGISKETARRAAEWVENDFIKADLRRRWWLKNNLARIPGIGKTWAYGKSFFLQQYAYDISEEALKAEDELIGKEREIELLEAALLKGSGANAVIVGEPGAGKNTVLLGLAKMIIQGKVFPELEHWRIWKVQGAALIAAGKTPGEVSAILIKLLNEAARSGDAILAIDEFPEFVVALENLGVNAAEIFSPYLQSPQIHIIALADTLSFRRILESNEGLMKYFERVNISEPDYKGLVEILKDWAPETEAAAGYRTIVTYPAIQKISEAAMNYLTEGALPKRAVDLLRETVAEASQTGRILVTPELVLEIVERKTKMPLGKITEKEQEKLLKLEEMLHRRVIDQEEAIRGIADAIKRSRSGIRNPRRPIGSFLFLGPTGVGKTETSKALAEIYFGNEERMMRLDMTEYQDDDSISRLIGSFEKNEPGILASRIKASPYGVVLLDEFEKAHLKVKNLFLQILDEGFFSDYLGERVNMRNTIIIATSNAGSQLIWELTEKGQDVAAIERQIISYVQKERILAPELINRFDAVVIFRPLSLAMLKEIAKIMLGRLAERLKGQNITLKITDELIEAVAKGGYDPAFGARPMQRFIQDKIEKIIAEKIIKGEIKPGSEVTLSDRDL